MADIESAEAFTLRVAAALGCRVTPDFEAREVAAAQAMVADRDAAIRAEALREAADWLTRNVSDPDCERAEWERIVTEAAAELVALADKVPRG